MREHCTIPMRVCDFCGSLFARDLRSRRRFCSLACSVQGQRKRRPASPEDFAARFWAKVERTDDCWLWTGRTGHFGYGVVWRDGKHTRAHRVAWILTHGPIPAGLCVCHNCPGGDRPSCCNPAHLFLGTHTDNMQDMIAKGRQSYPSGMQHYLARLTDENVRAIRQRRAEGWIYTRIADAFGVSTSTILSIVKRKSWKHVT